MGMVSGSVVNAGHFLWQIGSILFRTSRSEMVDSWMGDVGVSDGWMGEVFSVMAERSFSVVAWASQ